MTKEEFERLVFELKRGNNEELKRLQVYQSYCIKSLIIKSKHSCQEEDAYDIFIDAVMDFRRNVLNDKVTFGTIKAYLFRICWNKWLEQYRRKMRKRQHIPKVEQELYQANQLSAEDEIIEEEKRNSTANQQLKQQQLIKQAMKYLSEKCQKILHLAIVEEAPMKVIAQQLGFANANVAKSTKLRCYNRLIKNIRKLES